MHRKRKLQLARAEKREYVTSENRRRRKTKAGASHVRLDKAARALRNSRPRRSRKKPTRYNGPILVTTNMARVAAMSPKLNHVKFAAELEAERKIGRGRLFRGMHSDRSIGWRERFGQIAARTDYERRRGR